MKICHTENTRGFKAIYQCPTGKTLHGDRVRYCTNEGTWTGNEPICLGKLQILVFYVIVYATFLCNIIICYSLM